MKISNIFFKTDKWLEAETIEQGSKLYTKISFSVIKVVTENKAKTPAKYNNFLDQKSYETSPRLNYMPNKTSTPYVAIHFDESDLEPLSSFRKQSLNSNNVKSSLSGMVKIEEL